jgi:short-subunit dehydrogenase
MPVTPFVEESVDSIRRQVDINLHGVIAGSQMAIARMQPRGAGHIVNIASQAGKGGVPGIATYSATKHAVVGLSEAIRTELRGSGVEVSCVMPTVVNTELTTGVGQRLIQPVEAGDVADAIADALEAPRFDVWVPRFNGGLFKLIGLLPRGAREALGRLMKVDKLMTEVDRGARRAYEERAAHSEPGLESESGAGEAAEPAVERDAA